MSNFFINFNYFQSHPTYVENLPINDLIPALEHFSPIISSKIKSLETHSANFSLIKEIELLFWEFDQARQMVGFYYNLNQTAEVGAIIESGDKIAIDLFSELSQNSTIFNLVKNIPLQGLAKSEKKLIESWLLTFKMSGCGLSDSDKKNLVHIDTRIAEIEVQYNELITKESNEKTFAYVLADCAGVPQATLDDAKPNQGMVYFNDNHCSDIYTYAHNSHLREMAYRHSKSIGKNSVIDSMFMELNHLRHDKANILGFTSYAEMSLSNKMAKNLSGLNEVIDPILQAVKPKAMAHYEQIENFAISQGADKVNPWDYSYYDNLLAIKLFNLDLQKIKVYFPKTKVWEGLLTLVQNKWNLTLVPHKKLNHGQSFKAYLHNEFLGEVVVDLDQRDHKMTGAWMDNFLKGGFNSSPVVLLSCNFNPQDPYIDLDEINTLFHEMGHVIHGLVNQTYYPSQNGTDVGEDFIEFPSQFMENWVLEPWVLDLISQGTESSPVPEGLGLKIKQYQFFSISTWVLRQFYYLNLDLNFYLQKYKSFDEVVKMEQNLYQTTYGHEPVLGGTCINNFGHTVDSNYAASYFIYLWASILEKDAFIHMKESGQDLWRELLQTCFQSKGEDEMERFLQFKQSHPSATNFLKAYLLE